MRYLTLPAKIMLQLCTVSARPRSTKKKVSYETFPRVLEYIIHYIPPLVSFSIFKKFPSSKIYLLSTNSAVSLPSLASSNLRIFEFYIA
ncbi:hypothetical protein F4813DRAFT_171453 [Daldinia decipiens]|uniref:uncharacterized protein n=1 Tax=Daldinia decipiens TaxID=326647 RepID=UPI0020C3EC9C|nr:uncharacterized protein F4813DRAFT_171453 [Daldinia decipiens]KAI1661735.1 hypothetical protein F4813DRAFT_171453 [Daldinia decipiens]